MHAYKPLHNLLRGSWVGVVWFASATPIVQVYVINLARRPERRRRMCAILDELGYNYTIFTAVNGRYHVKSYYRFFNKLHAFIICCH